jgi:hypothetical protein
MATHLWPLLCVRRATLDLGTSSALAITRTLQLGDCPSPPQAGCCQCRPCRGTSVVGQPFPWTFWRGNSVRSVEFQDSSVCSKHKE